MCPRRVQVRPGRLTRASGKVFSNIVDLALVSPVAVAGFAFFADRPLPAAWGWREVLEIVGAVLSLVFGVVMITRHVLEMLERRKEGARGTRRGPPPMSLRADPGGVHWIECAACGKFVELSPAPGGTRHAHYADDEQPYRGSIPRARGDGSPSARPSASILLSHFDALPLGMQGMIGRGPHGTERSAEVLAIATDARGIPSALLRYPSVREELGERPAYSVIVPVTHTTLASQPYGVNTEDPTDVRGADVLAGRWRETVQRAPSRPEPKPPIDLPPPDRTNS